MPSNCPILCHPPLLLTLIFPSIRVFSNRSALCIRCSNYWSFSSSISPSNEYPGLISFRIDWFDLLAVQGTLRSLLQNHDSKGSVLWCSAFFMSPTLSLQLSHPYMTTGKVITLIIWTFVGKLVSLLFNIVIAFLQEASIFKCHGCSHHQQWFWSPRKKNLSFLLLKIKFWPSSYGCIHHFCWIGKC